MEDLAIAALAHAGSAVFHAVVHIAGHESYDALKLGLHKRLLHNHDVARALRESLVAALKLVEHDCVTSSGLPKKQVKRAFDSLRSQSLQLFALNTLEEKRTDDEGVQVPTDDSQLSELSDALLRLASDAPDSVRAALRQNFGRAFSFAFTEIGLKHNDAVRTAVFYSLLVSARRSAAGSDIALKNIASQLERGMAMLESERGDRRVGREFQETTSKRLQEIVGQIGEMAELQEKLLAIVSSKAHSGREAHAYLVVSDEDRCPLAFARVCEAEITIGRDPRSGIPLPHSKVSRNHARLVVRADSAELRDLGSSNGTYVNGIRIDRSMSIGPGDEIAIGPFRIELRAPDVKFEQLVTFETVSDV
jgi:hypothetical protein